MKTFLISVIYCYLGSILLTIIVYLILPQLTLLKFVGHECGPLWLSPLPKLKKH